MSLSVATYTPALGQQSLVDDSLELLLDNAVLRETSFHIIDNASKEPITSPFAAVIRNEENKGMVGTLRQAREHCTAEILVYLHSDMFIYHEGWDREIATAFENDPKLGLLGVVGAEWATKDGGRALVHCAFRDWVSHGHKPTKMITPVAILDGCFCAFRKSMMEELDIPEVYGDGNEFFFYDKELSLTCTMASWRVGVINLDCQHLGGSTSCGPEFIDSLADKGTSHDEMYQRSEQRYLNKWKDQFTVKVAKDWTVHVSMDTSHIVTAWRGLEPFAHCLVRVMKPKLIVELGVDYGFSLIELARYNPGLTIGVDHFGGDANAGYRNIKDKAVSNVEASGLNIRIIQQKFDDAVVDFEDGEIDILHVDGLHEFAYVKHDFETWFPKVRSGGVILLHDTQSFRNDVGVFFDSLPYTKFEIPYSHGLGVVYKP